MRQHAALMQHDEVIARHDLVEQMRRPEYADALFGDELADVVEDVGTRLDVKADGGLIETQATAEKGSYSRSQLNSLIDLAESGLKDIFAAQRAVLGG